MASTHPWGVTMHVNTCTLRCYILGTAELIVLKFVTYAETDMICGFSARASHRHRKSLHSNQCTCARAHSTSFLGSWLELGDSRLIGCGISTGNF